MNIKKLVAPLDENEIKKHWQYTDKIYISCVCLTFNQKDYIRDTIDSFLAQETKYRFEIIIHDDVSTDGTRGILLEYKNKYPSIIKLVLQYENQYSQGKRIAPLAVEHAEGEYIALCEGDDFWINKHKLQKQIIELEENKNINICFTAAYGLDPQNNISNLCDYKKNKIFNCDDVILGGGPFMPTASLMIRKKILDNLPDWFYDYAPVGDYFIQVLASENGAIYICEYSTVYRINAVGSWTSKVSKISIESLLETAFKWDESIKRMQMSNKLKCNRLAWEYYFLAVQCLNAGYRKEFKILIEKSYRSDFLNLKQMLYYVRSWFLL